MTAEQELERLREGLRAMGYIVGKNPDGEDETVDQVLLIVRDLKEFAQGLQLSALEIRNYLDDAIIKWRFFRESNEVPGNVQVRNARKMAADYIDAFQSMRSTLFGALLPAIPRK